MIWVSFDKTKSSSQVCKFRMSDGTFDNSGSKFSSSHLLVKQHRPRDLCGQSERCGTQKNAKLQMTISLTIIFFLHLQRCRYFCYCLFLFLEARAKGFPKDPLPNSTRHFLCTTSSTSFTSQTSSTSPASILHHVHHLQKLHFTSQTSSASLPDNLQVLIVYISPTKLIRCYLHCSSYTGVDMGRGRKSNSKKAWNRI